jgi:hypothetical protein
MTAQKWECDVRVRLSSEIDFEAKMAFVEQQVEQYFDLGSDYSEKIR